MSSDPSPPAQQFSLRRATPDDARMLAQLHRQAFFHAMPHMPILHTEDEDLDFYTTVVFPSTETWVSEISGVVGGFIAFRSGWVDHLYVHPEHLGCGMGSALLELAQSAQAKQELRLWTFQCNLRARRFYEHHGFRVELETDGSGNEEKQPDVLYLWQKPPLAASQL